MTIRKGSNIIAGTSQGDLNNKANISLNNLDTAGQAVLDAKANNVDVVHLTGIETITNEKIFENTATDSRDIVIKDNYTSQSSLPADNSFKGIRIVDTNNTGLAELLLRETSNARELCSRIIGLTGVSSDIRIGVNSSNVVYTTAPASDFNNSIVTTVNNSKSQNGYFQLGNGLIIQWGWISGRTISPSTSAVTTITFPKAFTSTGTYFANTTLAYNNRTQTSVVLEQWNDASSTTASLSVNLIAIGY